MTISGADNKDIAYLGLLTNHGTITQSGTTQVVTEGTLHNAADGTYNLTGDGGLASGYHYGLVQNDGLFEKTGGTGTSTIGSMVVFSNTGNVEVDSGTLSFQGGGSLANGHYIFTNGGIAQFYNLGSGVTVSGANTISGDGTLQFSAGLVYANGGTTATFTNLTDGANILINGGSVSGGAGSTVRPNN